MRRLDGAFNWPEMRTYTRKLVHLIIIIIIIINNKSIFIQECQFNKASLNGVLFYESILRREETGVPGGNPRLKLNSHTTFVVEVEGVIDAHYASLTSQSPINWRLKFNL